MSWVKGSHLPSAPLGSFQVINTSGGSDARLNIISPNAYPIGWGNGGYGFGMWAKLFTGRTVGDGASGQNVWPNNNPTIDAAPDGWFAGAALFDGVNNNARGSGSLYVQIVATGRVRWLIGDGSGTVGSWGMWAVQNTAGANLIDNQWHWLEFRRALTGGATSTYTVWIDNVQQASQVSDVQTDMYTTYWTSFAGWPAGQEGAMIGAEKISALGGTPWTGFWGRVTEVRYWNRAKSDAEMGNADSWRNNQGLVGSYRMPLPGGTTVPSGVPGAPTITATASGQTIWSADRPAGG